MFQSVRITTHDCQKDFSRPHLDSRQSSLLDTESKACPQCTGLENRSTIAGNKGSNPCRSALANAEKHSVFGETPSSVDSSTSTVALSTSSSTIKRLITDRRGSARRGRRLNASQKPPIEAFDCITFVMALRRARAQHRGARARARARARRYDYTRSGVPKHHRISSPSLSASPRFEPV